MNTTPMLLTATILVPAIFTLLHQWLRPHAWGPGAARGAHALAAAALGVYATLVLGWPRGLAAGWGVPPFGASPAPLFLLRLFLFAAWFGITARWLVMARAESLGGDRTAAPRSATLRPRHGGATASPLAWHFVQGTWALGLATTLAGAFAVGRDLRSGWAGAAWLLGTALALAWSAPAAVRATLEEAEPRDPHGGSALSEAYAVQRQLRVGGQYWLVAALVTWLSLVAAAGVWAHPGGGVVRVVAEASAFAIGLAASGFGIRVAEERRRVEGLLDRLRAEQAPA